MNNLEHRIENLEEAAEPPEPWPIVAIYELADGPVNFEIENERVAVWLPDNGRDVAERPRGVNHD